MAASAFLLAAAAIMVAAGFLVVRLRRRFWACVATVAGAMLALSFLLLASGTTVPLVFEESMAALSAVLVVAFATALVLRFLFPRLGTRSHAGAIAILSATLAGAHLVAAATLWYAADQGAQLAKAPIAVTEADIIALRDGPYRRRLFGVLTAAHLGDPSKMTADGTPDRSEITRYACRATDDADDSWFPTILALTLGDGRRILAHGPRQVRQAWNWPPGDLRLGQCALRNGDPVVVWSNVSKDVRIGDGAEAGGLIDTRLVAYGDLETFRRGYMRPAIFTGRLFSWIAALAALLALVPAYAGLRRIRHLRRQGAH